MDALQTYKEARSERERLAGRVIPSWRFWSFYLLLICWHTITPVLIDYPWWRFGVYAAVLIAFYALFMKFKRVTF